MNERPNLERLAEMINESQRPETLALLLALLATKPRDNRGDDRGKEPEIVVR